MPKRVDSRTYRDPLAHRNLANALDLPTRRKPADAAIAPRGWWLRTVADPIAPEPERKPAMNDTYRVCTSAADCVRRDGHNWLSHALFGRVTDRILAFCDNPTDDVAIGHHADYLI